MSYHPLANLGGGFAGRRSAGEGEGVLWLHPYALDSSCWTEVWDHLPRWRHVGVDLPGHGCSEPLDLREDLHALARRLADVAARHQVRHVVGLSLGAAVALAIALEPGTKLESLVLASPVPAGAPETDVYWRRYRELANMYGMAGFGAHLRGRLMLVEPSVFDGARAIDGLWDRLWRIVGRHPFWDLAHAGYLRACSTAPPDDALRNLETPTLLITGANDSFGSGAVARRWAAGLPRAVRPGDRGAPVPPSRGMAGTADEEQPSYSLRVLPRASHLGLLEVPAAAAAVLDVHFGARTASARDAATGLEERP